jgi:hypothetical protein
MKHVAEISGIAAHWGSESRQVAHSERKKLRVVVGDFESLSLGRGDGMQ